MLIDRLNDCNAQGWPIYYISWGLCLIGENKLIMGCYGLVVGGYWLGCLPLITAIYRLSFYIAVGHCIPCFGFLASLSLFCY
jgi:hypothetical protein